MRWLRVLGLRYPNRLRRVHGIWEKSATPPSKRRIFNGKIYVLAEPKAISKGSPLLIANESLSNAR